MRKAFDRDVFRVLNGVKSEDLNRVTGEGAHNGLRDLLRFTSLPVVSMSATTTQQAYGFYGDGFLVLPQSPVSGNIVLSAGIAVKRDDTDQPVDIGGIPGLDENSAVKPIVLRDARIIATAPPPPAPNKRIDTIEVRVARDFYDSVPVKQLDPTSGTSTYPTALKTLSYAIDDVPVEYIVSPANGSQPLVYKQGVAAPVPVAPAVSPGYVKVAEILVENVVANPAGTIRQEHLADFRPMAFLGGTGHFAIDFVMSTVAGVPTIVSYAVPPGIRIALSRKLSAGSEWLLYVLNNCKANFSATYGDVGTLASFSVASSSTALPGFVGAGDKAQIDNPARTVPTQTVPLGHPVVVCTGDVFSWDGATFISATGSVRVVVKGTLS